jgi:hypothetical protein
MDNHSIPAFVTQYFWGDDLAELDIERNRKYIVQTILERGDSDALLWLFAKVDKQTVKELLPTLKLSKKSANFWGIYLS